MQYLPVIFGAVLAFVFTMIGVYIQQIIDKKQHQKRTKALILLIIREIHEGISRCESIIKLREEKKISLSRIYVAVWDSARVEVSEFSHNLKIQSDILGLLHTIYYRFDLVNFNMQQKQYGAGGAFAEQYLEEIRNNLHLVEEKLCKLGITLPTA